MHNGLCKWSAGLKVMNFQNRTEPIRLFNISNFPSIVEDELAVLQRRTAVELPAETRITFTIPKFDFSYISRLTKRTKEWNKVILHFESTNSSTMKIPTLSLLKYV